MKKIIAVLVALLLIGAALDPGRFPIEVADLADGNTNNVLGWNGSGAAVSQRRDGARIYFNSSTSIPNSSNTFIDFDTERYDDNDLHSTVSLTERMTAADPGKYFISCTIRWPSNSTGIRSVNIFLNGGQIIASNQINAVGSSSATIQTVSTVWDMADSDFVEIRVFQNSGGSLNVERTTNYSPEFTFQQVTN